MAVTREELESFRRFALQRVESGSELTLELLVDEWRQTRDRDDANAAIRQGVADMEAGNYRSLDDFMNQFCANHNIPDDA